MNDPLPTGSGADEPGAASCWRRIGVWGSVRPRCERLETLVHCHNCEVFVAAARLEQGLPPEASWRDDWAEEYRQGIAQVDTAGRESMLEFHLDGRAYALPARCVDGAAELQTPRLLPHRSDRLVNALVHMQGQLQIHADLRRLLGQSLPRAVAASGGTGRTLLVGRAPNGCFAISVDLVPGMFSMTPDMLKPLPASLNASTSPWLRGVVQRSAHTATVLDDEAMLAHLARDLS